MPNDSLNLKDLITVKKSDEVDSTGNEGKKEEKELSPLERMKNFKETHTGTIVNNEDITYDNEKKVLKNSVENDRGQIPFPPLPDDKGKPPDSPMVQAPRTVRGCFSGRAGKNRANFQQIRKFC